MCILISNNNNNNNKNKMSPGPGVIPVNLVVLQLAFDQNCKKYSAQAEKY